MAKIMGLPSPDTAPQCLACHALDVPADQRARTFDLTDGVGCENCHGPASDWLGPHTTRGLELAQSIEAGMYDTRDLVHRSEKCLTCHLGTPEKIVDHEMIAAGPSRIFISSWLRYVGDAAALEGSGQPIRGLRCARWPSGKPCSCANSSGAWRANRRAASGPNTSELDCFACHHNLAAAKDSWRQERGYAGPPSRQSAVESLALRGAAACDPGADPGATRGTRKRESIKV